MDQKKPDQASTPAEPASTEDKRQILLVEDHEDSATMLTFFLESIGHSVVLARTLAEAAALLVSRQFDGLLCDLGLPDGCGISLLDSIGQQASIKTVALTGFAGDDDIQRARNAGFHYHLRKPVDFGTLQQALHKMFEES